MSPRIRYLSGVVRAIPFCLALGATGCSMDEVQFNGGIFDAVGLSDSAKVNGKEPKLAKRAPLVVPPSLERLPDPGTEAPQDEQIAGIKDPDALKVASKEEQERQQAEYCKANYEPAVRQGDEVAAANATGPLGPCRPSVLNSYKKWTSDESE